MIGLTNELGHTTYWLDTQELAKALSLKDNKGKYIGRNRLMKVLRWNKILDKHNQPQIYFMNLGLIMTHKTTKRYKGYLMPVYSERCVEFMRKRFAEGKYQIVFEEKKPQEFLDINQIC